jgi:hypothetical protein
VLVATDVAGAPRADVRVKMDGNVFAPELNGKALPVDPGLHEFAFSADGRVFATMKVLIVQGQRNRVISASMAKRGDEKTAAVPVPAAAATPAPPEPGNNGDKGDSEGVSGGKIASEKPASQRRSEGAPGGDVDVGGASNDRGPNSGGTSWFAYTLGVTGLAAVGAGALLTYWGNHDNSLLSQCSPNCEPSSIDHIRRLYLASDIAFGGGALAIGLATVLFATSHSSAAPPRAAYGVEVQPVRSGALASFAKAF